MRETISNQENAYHRFRSIVLGDHEHAQEVGNHSDSVGIHTRFVSRIIRHRNSVAIKPQWLKNLYSSVNQSDHIEGKKRVEILRRLVVAGSYKGKHHDRLEHEFEKINNLTPHAKLILKSIIVGIHDTLETNKKGKKIKNIKIRQLYA